MSEFYLSKICHLSTQLFIPYAVKNKIIIETIIENDFHSNSFVRKKLILGESC
jgi:hypothetical protein